MLNVLSRRVDTNMVGDPVFISVVTTSSCTVLVCKNLLSADCVETEAKL